MTATLFTIGFTRKGAERFFGLLEEAGVRLLLDIRARPGSQLAGFARGPDLQWLLKRLCDIDYLAVPALAPGPGLLDAYRKAELDWPGYERRYLAELQPADIAAQLAGIPLDRACLLCAEEGADHCHRRLAAEWLNQADPALHIRHLR